MCIPLHYNMLIVNQGKNCFCFLNNDLKKRIKLIPNLYPTK